MMNYLDELNQSQRDAVLYNEGPLLVIAGAGSGKTRVLTYKIAYLLDNGYEPWSILALTFTNKAAREMKERIARQVGMERARYLWMGTFHSVFSRILRAEAAAVGFTPNFTIYDAADSKSLVKSIIKEMKLDDKTYRPGMVLGRISNAKNHLVLPDAYAASAEFYRSDQDAKIPLMREIYARYWERCRQSDAMDFDDLLVYTFLLFKQHPDICRRYAERFRYILVDEYQDTNFAQHSIVLQLTGTHSHVCVVGDDAQSIYSFRGANIDNILKFTQLYKDARLFKLEQNYRSTQTIVKAANSLIAKNKEQIRKEVFSEKDKGEPIPVYSAYSDMEEGEIVANKIGRLHARDGYAYSDCAVLYRTNAQSRIFEESLRKHNLPYRIYGGLSFYQRKEIKDVIAYFRLAVNPNDEEAFKRVINYPTRGIGDTTLNKLIEAATREKVSLWAVLNEPLSYNVSINKGTHTKLQGFRDLIAGFVEGVETKDAYELGSGIIRQSGILGDIYQDRSPENLSRQENIEELVNGIHDFCSMRREEGNDRIRLTDYLSEISLLTDQDSNADEDQPKVTLMTIHSAKGLEFKNVFVVGMEEGLFPSLMSSDSYRALEEERRLFYVAITRAEDHCFLSYAKNRLKYGKMEFCNPSRFLKDIDARYLSLPQDTSLTRQVDEYSSRFRSNFSRRDESPVSATDMFADEPRRFVKPQPQRTLRKVPVSSSASVGAGGTAPVSPGQQIEHERFGKGEILRVEGTGDNCKATVRFQNAGEKQLLLKYARFKVIG
ncbi:ATP-dependent helicase [Bacteroides caecicola]|uniref:ATP-dependent helicase n=1 Tax=Bacteroides caecicola TaxID=1462569 RepID=UPI002013077F|nr:UvrD-helicase domain-containing protein [Bacteroides caecicola]MCL1626077.1 UvrD-helicase domain-containing protein [Bacteroides caecicola]